MIGTESKYLVVVAHPDDEVLGCGATIARLIESGCEVRILMLNPQHKVEKQIVNACQTLGVSNDHLHVKRFPGRFDQLAKVEIHSYLRDMVRSYLPDIVLTHWSNDLHVDHRIVAEAVMVETRPTFESCPKAVLMFPVVSSSDFNSDSFSPNLIVDVKEFIHSKVDAMKCYSEEYMNLKKWRGEQHIRGSAWFWGMKAGIECAEPFHIARYRL